MNSWAGRLLFAWRYQELIGCDCDGIVARDLIAEGCHWVTCGVVWMGCGAAYSGMRIAMR